MSLAYPLIDLDKFKLRSKEMSRQQSMIDKSALPDPIEGMAKMASLLMWETLCFPRISR